MPLNLTQKLLIGGVVAILLVVIGFFIDIELKKNTLSTLRTRVIELERKINVAEKEFADETNRYDQLKVGSSQLLEMQVENQNLEGETKSKREKLGKLIADWESERSVFRQLIAGVREESKTVPIPSVTLRNGKTLKVCKVTSIANGAVRIEHTEGAARFAVEDLPDELAERLKLSWRPRLALPTNPYPTESDLATAKRLEQEFADISEPSVPVASPTVLDQLAQGVGAANRLQIIDTTKNEISRVLGVISELIARRNNFEAIYDRLADGRRMGEGLSAPSSIPEGKRQARAGYQAMNVQIQASKRELQKLQTQLKELMK